MQRRSFKENAPLNQRLTERAERLPKRPKAHHLGLFATISFAKPGRRRQLRICRNGFPLPASSRPAEKMLTLVAILAGPIVVTTIVTIVAFEIKDAWDRNRLR